MLQAILTIPFLASSPTHAAELPAGFVRLADIDPTIRQDMRYAGAANFLGRRADGYDTPACLLTRQAAEALAKAQKALSARNLTLVALDCYRPQRAVSDFVAWTRQDGPPDPRWHPKLRRGELVATGYIGSRSAHARGSTVDVGIAPLQGPPAPDPSCGAAASGLMDFGTGFDCFDPASATESTAVSKDARANRALLVETMRAAGFVNYRREWWHFTLTAEPFPRRGFDFPVE